MTKILRSIVGLLALAIASTVCFAQTTPPTSAACQNAEVIGPKLITDICWNCIFPLRVAGFTLFGGSQSVPSDAADKPLCMCEDALGVPRPGVTTSLWEPARLIELQRMPGCSSVLNGVRLPFDLLFFGNHGNGELDHIDKKFVHYHYYAFPLLIMLDLFAPLHCNGDGYVDLDLMYLSELDPTWNYDELAFFTTPEAALVANPLAAMACVADAVAANSGEPLKQLFWCAGSWGELYPLSGHNIGGKDIVRDGALFSTRILAALHRRGLARRTMGNDAMCGGKIDPTLPKLQYRLNMLYPLPETNRAHPIGESTLIWGNGRIVPVVGEDPIFTLWRWNDCCNR